MTFRERLESRPSTLGDVLYAKNTQILASESAWVGLVHSIAQGDQLALHRLYTRADGIVFTWITRIVRNRETAEKLTLDVFQDVWRRASEYDATNHSVIGWIMDLARSTAPSPPTLDHFLSPAEVLRPSPSLWAPLSRRIASESGHEPLMPLPQGRIDPEWEEVAPGISCKLLTTDRKRNRVGMIVRLAPGAAYPAHVHAGVEELYLLHGELMIEDRKLYPGAYNRGEPGEGDRFVWSGTGCMCVLLTSTRDVLREMPPSDPVALQQFRAFCKGLRTEAYCLDCLGEMYEEPLSIVWSYLNEIGIVGRGAL